MEYGYTKEKILELKKNHILYKTGKILCLACYQENNEQVDIRQYFGVITVTHLKRKHPEEFGDKDKVIEHYKKIYSGVNVLGRAVMEKIYNKDANEKYKDVTLYSVKRAVAEAGGLGKYSQDQLLLLYEKTLKLADIYEKEGKYNQMLDCLKAAERIINNTAPSKANIPAERYTKKATEEDNEALDKLDKLLPFIEEDVKQIKKKNVSQKVLDGWTDPEDKRG